jgi:hypothetical protein
VSSQLLDEKDVERVRRRCRLLVLLDAAERAAITPIDSSRLHAFAYLADVLSPVFDLPAFDGKILRIEGGPHYPDLQDELDHLVVAGLVEVTSLSYIGRGNNGARLEGKYALNFESDYLNRLLAALGAADRNSALDEAEFQTHQFLVVLAEALATLPLNEIDRATSADVTYRSEGEGENVIDFGSWSEDPWADNPTWRTTDRFEHFMPEALDLTAGEKLYLYATYLGRAAHG